MKYMLPAIAQQFYVIKVNFLKDSSMFLSKTCEGILNCSLSCHKNDMWISSEKNCILFSRCTKILVELISLMCSILPLCCILSCPTKSVKRDSSPFRYLQYKLQESINYKGIIVHLAVKLILLIAWAQLQVHAQCSLRYLFIQPL